MRIAKSLLVEPETNDLYGIMAMVLSLFVFAYSTRFGQISILAFYGVWLPLVVVDYRRVLGNYFHFTWIFAFAILCFLSAFWSQAPSTSLRAATQYLTHVVCALIAMRVIAPVTLVRGSVVGCAVVLLYSLAFGSYSYDVLDSSYSFVGAFDSKNQLGFYASLGVLFCYALITVFRARGFWFLASLGSALISGYALFASKSATSVITTLAVICVCAVLQLSLWVSPRQRRAIFAIGIILAIGTAIAALQSGAVDAVLGAFGKDTTLTGRTYLWQQGIIAAHAAPWFGVGYQGYWVHGFADAERLWQEFYIASRTGFHFHNTYIETTVETGLVGTTLLTMVLLVSLFGHLHRFLMLDRSESALLLVSISMLLLVRSFVEIDILFAYQVGSFLLYYAAGRLTLAEPRAAHREAIEEFAEVGERYRLPQPK
ncbi:O-antigen ligase family protein [Rhizobium halophytocola]|uniref:Exopolysaccharide production protein ExoQ n=1 Tax=Rhizobium halophytocola TaxID=735519 RepID=A0ABS4E4S0_9HYPH|nr:O-antigen ligase [Rhizobium halophytocola]MBP1852946.1 exopolysaccharide production protein ExoQ [Rhizobium halophytocola]